MTHVSDLQLCIRLAKVELTPPTSALLPAEFWSDALDALAENIRKSNTRLTSEEAYVAALTSEDGATLYEAYTNASHTAQLRRLEKHTVDANFDDRDDNETDAVTAIEKAATALRSADPALSDEHAFAKALHDDPQLYQRYLEERHGRGR